MKSPMKFFKWGFFLLVALNITLIVLLLFSRRDHRHERFGPPDFGRIVQHLDKTLRLSGTQHEQIVLLFDRHRHEMDSVHHQSKAQHNRMIDCLKSGMSDCTALNDNPGFDQILFHHHQRILKILDASQQKQYLDDLDKHRPPGPPPF